MTTRTAWSGCGGHAVGFRHVEWRPGPSVVTVSRSGLGASPKQPTDTGLGASPKQPINTGLGASPKQPINTGLGASPKQPINTGLGASPKQPINTGLGASPKQPINTGLGASPKQPINTDVAVLCANKEQQTKEKQSSPWLLVLKRRVCSRPLCRGFLVKELSLHQKGSRHGLINTCVLFYLVPRKVLF